MEWVVFKVAARCLDFLKMSPGDHRQSDLKLQRKSWAGDRDSGVIGKEVVGEAVRLDART